ncbi:hypothetical protein [Microbacterium sp.]|uniref:hypothetical protein n=1 Tax=Microbacterium sp. TaxID=51671 RepID=UPI002810A8C4|nr:hypothetical protein [Microbacterium sp.]
MTVSEASAGGTPATTASDGLVLDFGDRTEHIASGTTFVIGRGTDLSIDDNQYVHRRFLEIGEREGIWWLTNVGSGLTASVASADGLAQSWLAPGASMPLVFRATTVMFTAGETTYEFSLTAQSPFYQVSTAWNDAGDGVAGLLSPVQRILLTSLAEPLLRQRADGAVQLPSPEDVARRLGWTTEKFHRRLGTLCDKFSRLGIHGLERGADGGIRASQRSRLVEHAVGARIVTADDLALLDAFVVQEPLAAAV